MSIEVSIKILFFDLFQKKHKPISGNSQISRNDVRVSLCKSGGGREAIYKVVDVIK